MEWSRVKNVLIVLLVIINLFLFIVYLSTTMSNVKDVNELITHTVNVLKRNGIDIEGDIIPENPPVLYPATATIFGESAGVTVKGDLFTVSAHDLKEASAAAGVTVEDKNGLMQYINGTPIYNSGVVYEEGILTGLAVKNAEAITGEEPHSVCGLLVSASEWLPKGRILSVEQGYFYNRTGEQTVYLLPVWRVSIREGVYYINAMNGERVEYLQK